MGITDFAATRLRALVSPPNTPPAPEPSLRGPSAGGLTLPRRFDERAAAVDAELARIGRDTTARVAELERAVSAARVAELADTKATREAAEQAQRDLGAELARDLRAELDPIVAMFDTEPAKAAPLFAATWTKLDARCRDELGAELSPHHARLSFERAAGAERVGRRHRYEHALTSRAYSLARDLVRALEHGIAIEIVDLARLLQVAVRKPAPPEVVDYELTEQIAGGQMTDLAVRSAFLEHEARMTRQPGPASPFTFDDEGPEAA